MVKKVGDDEIIFRFKMELGLEPDIMELSVFIPGDEISALPGEEEEEEAGEESSEISAFLEKDEMKFLAKLSPEDREIVRRMANRIFIAGSSVFNPE